MQVLRCIVDSMHKLGNCFIKRSRINLFSSQGSYVHLPYAIFNLSFPRCAVAHFKSMK